MRHMKTRVVVATLATLAVAVALTVLRADFPGGTVPRVHAQEDIREGCSLETLNGGYGLAFHGFGLITNSAVPAPISAFTPVAGGGIATFDGNGNLSISETVSLGGQILPLTLPGTYTVNPDCTGSLTAGSGFTAVHLNLVIVRNGREILAVNADQGRVAVDNFVKQ